jgi:hypothetical protein
MKHRLRIALAAAAAAVPVTLAACGGSTTESTSQTSSGLTDGVPKRAWLNLDLAAAKTQSVAAASQQAAQQPPPPMCVGGPPAMFAAMSAGIMQSSNGVLDGIMSLIENATSGPPADASPGMAVWGPITSPQSPSLYRVVVHQVAPDAFHFELDGTPKAGDQSNWAGVMQGTVQSPDPLHQAGDLLVDFGVAHALDPSNDPVAGGVAIHFENRPDGRGIDETFSGVVGKNAPQPNDAHYAFNAAPDGLTFDFVTRTDFDHDGVLDELLHVQSRWLPPGVGKASVVVTGGSIGPKPVAAAECWDEKQRVVFYTDDIHANVPLGNAACCPQ